MMYVGIQSPAFPAYVQTLTLIGPRSIWASQALSTCTFSRSNALLPNSASNFLLLWALKGNQIFPETLFFQLDSSYRTPLLFGRGTRVVVIEISE